MKRILPCLAALALGIFTPPAFAQSALDPIGDLIQESLQDPATTAEDLTPDWALQASLYHGGAPGVGGRDSLGCPTVAMRTAAIDRKLVPRRTLLFIKETVGLPMPDGSTHDGYWYASDVGGAIKGSRIDLFTGSGRSSMAPLMKLNMKTLTVARAGAFEGCPQAGLRIAAR
ncbi:MAG: 3D domain-containing protein [Caulobacter sp.]|nr:3D domain-containing protein [Caulobacter sp.]